MDNILFLGTIVHFYSYFTDVRCALFSMRFGCHRSQQHMLRSGCYPKQAFSVLSMALLDHREIYSLFNSLRMVLVAIGMLYDGFKSSSSVVDT
jgi:hypothetical protein